MNIRASDFTHIGDRVVTTRKDGEEFIVTLSSDDAGKFYRVQHNTERDTTFSDSVHSATATNLRTIMKEINAAVVPPKAEPQTFAAFVATREAHDDICAAVNLQPDEMNIDSARPGWLYHAEEPYYLIQLDADCVGAVVTIDTIAQPTLEAAEASLYALTHDSGEVDQFCAIRTQFPHYDDILPLLVGFENTTWKNDSCPSFRLEFGGYEAVLWCDYRNPMSRQLSEEPSEQFTLTIGTCDDFEAVANKSLTAIPATLATEVLSAIYVHWCAAQGLPDMSADELLFESLSDAQSDWLEDYMAVWEAVA